MALKDLRDPVAVGEALLEEAHLMQTTSFADYSLSRCADALADFLGNAPNYNANPSCLEKYGRPQDLPPTPF